MNNWTPHPSGHTDSDATAFEAAGVDPYSTQPRERVTVCRSCFGPTWNLSAHCDAKRCYTAPHAVRAAVLEAAS